MVRLLLSMAACILLTVSAAFAAGLGSTHAEFEREWNKGYRAVFPFGDQSHNVQVGLNDRFYVMYSTGPASHSFGKPERIGEILIGDQSISWFSGGDNSAVSVFKKVRSLMPADAKLIAAYKREQGYLSEKYQFRSDSLARMKGIKDAITYQSFAGLKGDPVGTFQLIVNYQIGSYTRVANMILALGLDDHEGLTRIRKNPFK